MNMTGKWRSIPIKRETYLKLLDYVTTHDVDVDKYHLADLILEHVLNNPLTLKQILQKTQNKENAEVATITTK